MAKRRKQRLLVVLPDSSTVIRQPLFGRVTVGLLH